MRTRAYRWHPVSAPFELLDARPRSAHASAVQGLAIGSVLAIPPIGSAIGIPSPWSLVLVAPWIAWMELIALQLHRRAGTLAGLRVITTGNLALGTTISAGLAAATGRADTPLWALPVMYACFNGSSLQLEASLLSLGAHVLSVLLTIPILVARGVPLREAIATPIVIALVCAVSYDFLSMRARDLRLERAETERLRMELEAERAARARARLARDLHDAVGANLSAAAVYADLLARSGDEASAKKLADSVASAARQGLTELRGLLEGLAPNGVDAGAFGRALHTWGETIASGAGVAVRVEVDDPTIPIDAEVRLTLVRVFQEALQNVIKHAGARAVVAHLGSEEPGALRLSIRDDGRGFDPRRAARGRGLRHVEERAAELGGRAEIRSSDAGTEIAIVIPRAAVDLAARPPSRRDLAAQG